MADVVGDRPTVLARQVIRQRPEYQRAGVAAGFDPRETTRHPLHQRLERLAPATRYAVFRAQRLFTPHDDHWWLKPSADDRQPASSR
ncbi:hypothetical protein ABT294_35030 [Nonomuraea sp. NPDC000554]|uniref:hypothetical protein n=1 Tax=Nonomuraea sp. NPDC000554 TaxID=3154259 RepID=UPI00332E6F27